MTIPFPVRMVPLAPSVLIWASPLQAGSSGSFKTVLSALPLDQLAVPLATLPRHTRQVPTIIIEEFCGSSIHTAGFKSTSPSDSVLASPTTGG